jgi:integrase/recombinase XerD
MTEKMMTPLRQRMIDDMTIRNLSPSTKKIYIYAVAKFSRFHGRSPDKLTMEDVRDYRLHLIARGYQPTSINPIMGALRFFYATTLGQKDAIEHMPYARTADRLPAVLTGDEVARFLKAVADFKMRTLFITIYAAGLRVSEAVALTAKDIDSARMVIVVRQGKGRKDRYGYINEGPDGALELLFSNAKLQGICGGASQALGVKQRLNAAGSLRGDASRPCTRRTIWARGKRRREHVIAIRADAFPLA